jgi:hypothetical protein
MGIISISKFIVKAIELPSSKSPLGSKKPGLA